MIGPQRMPTRIIGRRAALLLTATSLLAGCATMTSIFNGDIFEDMFTTKKVPLPGKRIPVAVGGPDVTAHANTTPVQLPPAQQNPSWLEAGGNASHAMGHLALAGQLTKTWTADIGEGGGYRRKITAQPLIAGQRVFTMDSDGSVNAFGLDDGRRQWRTETQAEDDRSTNIGGGISTDGTIVYAGTGRAELLAIDAASGAIKWRQPTGPPARSGPTIDGGRLYVPTIDSRILAFNTDGKKLWAYQATNSVTSVLGEMAPAVANGLVVAGFGSGDLVGLRAETGAVAWTDTLAPIGGRNSVADFSAVRGLPVIDQGRAYAIGLGGLMVCLDVVSGRRLWERQLAGANTPWLAGNSLFVVTTDNALQAIATDDGGTRWAVQLDQYENPERKRDPITWFGPVLVNNRLVLSGTNSQMISVNPLDGSTIGSHVLSAPASLAPTVAAGMLFLVSADSTLLAMR